MPAKNPTKKTTSSKKSTTDIGTDGDPLAGLEDLVGDLDEKPPAEEEDKVSEELDLSEFELTPEEEAELAEALGEVKPPPVAPSEQAGPAELPIAVESPSPMLGDEVELAPPEVALGSEQIPPVGSESTPASDAVAADFVAPVPLGPEGPIPAAVTEPASTEGSAAEVPAPPVQTAEGAVGPEGLIAEAAVAPEGSIAGGEIPPETPGGAPVPSEERLEASLVKVEGEVSPSISSLDEKSFTKAQIEASLFVAGRPVSIEELQIKLEARKTLIQQSMADLAMDYMDRVTSLEIVQVGEDKFAMQIKPEFTDRVKKFATGGLIPEAVMRTLTIIALKQPLLKSLLIKLRGSGAYEHVKFLLDRGLVRTEKKGRSDDLTTTDAFADMFGLSRDITKLKVQLKTQLGVKEEDEEEDTTPPPPPEVPDL